MAGRIRASGPQNNDPIIESTASSSSLKEIPKADTITTTRILCKFCMKCLNGELLEKHLLTVQLSKIYMVG